MGQLKKYLVLVVFIKGDNKMSYKQIIIIGLITAGLLCWLMYYLYSVVNELPAIN